MNNPTQHRSWILGIHRRVAGAALALAIMLVVAVVATRPARAQTFTYSVLYSFMGSPDGEWPVAGLVLDAQGNLYGTTGQGGDLACGVYGCGTAFKVDSTGKETVLYSFTGATDGALPYAGLVLDAQGNLYGTTAGGGTYGSGTVFKLDTTGKETVLHSFTGKSGDGADPWAGLVLDARGNLYGTTELGGDSACSTTPFGRSCGTVFKVDTTGKETVLYSFTGKKGDGAVPRAGLVLDAQGNLYGTTYLRGAHNEGTVFKVDRNGKETVLYSFTGTGGDGYFPGGLVLDAQGNLYGTTYKGGAHNKGTVFKVDTTGKETVLYSFAGRGRDGTNPWAGLVLDAQGNLYGTTEFGGGACNWGGLGCGTVFKVDTTGKETVLYRFTGAPDGALPRADLVLDAQGNLYGTTNYGGAYDRGMVFKLTP